MTLKFKKWWCKNFGCKIQKTIGPGFFHVECHRCGETFKLTRRDDDNFQTKVTQAILVDCALFGQGFNIEDYRKASEVKND